jgi:signal transduction histidine kinase
MRGQGGFGFTGGLVLAFGIIASIFVGSTLISERLNGEIAARSAAAASDALPSVVHLTAAADALRDLEAATDDYAEVSEEQRVAIRATIDQRWRAMDAALTAYVRIPAYAGQRELYESTVPAALRDVDASLRHLFAQVDDHQPPAAWVTADRDVRRATTHAATLLRNMVSLNAKHAEEDLDRSQDMHAAALRRALLLDGFAILCTVALAIWVLRRFRAHDRLLAAHTSVVTERAAELEVFGQRVAHDLLGPLSALTYCLGAFKRASETDPKLQDALTRARSCVTRAQGMVYGIFEFARAGGRPEADGRADLRDIVEQVRDSAQAAEAAERPRVDVEPFEDVAVACTPGVLMSVLSNLVRNATKYMSDSAVKEITLRVRERESFVRVEVEDTGPGVPLGLEQRIFEPYVRAEGVTQPGLGLGLATVKRLCESHGGEVGVRSRPGRGSVFWFSLPKPKPTHVAPATSSDVRLLG